ncbi:DMT family transporter [Deferribacteraceae bacterium V6Fe1]|nr:DMT family transporter [Deferribacteraceae bacterium V6Fe1]
MFKGVAAAIVSAVCFAFLAIFAKLGYNLGISTSDMLFFRFALGFLTFTIYFLIKDYNLFFIKKINLLKAFFAGSFLYFTQSNLFFLAVKNISVSTASLILYMYPLFVTILSIIIFKYKLNTVTSISLGLIILGSCLIFYDAFANKYSFFGILCALGAATTFSFYLIFIQYSLQTQKPLTFSFYVILFASITFAFNADYSMPVNHNTILLILGLSFVSTFLAISLLYVSIEIIGAVYASIFSSIEPVITVLASVVILSEKVNSIKVAGMTLILISILLPQLKKLRFMTYEQKSS